MSSVNDQLRSLGVPNKKDPSTYDDAFIRKNVSSGKDAERAAKVDALVAQAKAGNQDAIHSLQNAAGIGDAGQGLATADAKNYAKMQLNALGVDAGGYAQQHDGGGFAGSVGGVLKTVAPLAGLIPGIGIPLGAALAAGGSAAGGALHGDQFNLGKTLLAGAAGGVGGALNPFGANAAGALSTGAAPAGGGVPAAANAAGGGGGILGKVFGNGSGGLDLGKILGTAATIGGVANAAHTQNQADNQRNAAIQGATQDWQSRAPLRSAAQTGLLGLTGIQRPDLSSTFADPGNPFYKKPAAIGGGN